MNIKKFSILLAMSMFFSLAKAAPTEFMTQVNSAWVANDNATILQLANTEAAKTPANPEANVVLFEYNVLIAGNNQQALQQLNQLITVLQTVRPTAVPGVQQYRDAFSTVPSNTTNVPATAQQLMQLHRLFYSEFPAKTLMTLISTNN